MHGLYRNDNVNCRSTNGIPSFLRTIPFPCPDNFLRDPRWYSMNARKRKRNHSHWLEALQDLREAKRSRQSVNDEGRHSRDRDFESCSRDTKLRDAYSESANNCNADTHSAVNEGRQSVDRYLESCSPSTPQKECGTTNQRRVGDENELTREQTLMPYFHENLRTSSSIPNSPIEEETMQTDEIESNESALDDEANNSDQNAENEPDMEILQHNLGMWNESLNLAAMVAIVGSVRYTVELYQYTRNVLKDVGSGLTWPY